MPSGYKVFLNFDSTNTGEDPNLYPFNTEFSSTGISEELSVDFITGEYSDFNFTYQKRYDLSVCENDVPFEYNYSCTGYFYNTGEYVHKFELNDFTRNTQFDLNICYPDEVELDRLHPYTLEYNYPTVCPDIGFAFEPMFVGEVAGDNSDIEYSPLYIKVERIGVTPESDFNLTTCAPSSDFSLRNCLVTIPIHGKKKQFDLNICYDELLRFDTEYYQPLEYKYPSCEEEELILPAFGGQDVTVYLADYVKFSADSYPGQYADADLAPTYALPLNSYTGQYADADLHIFITIPLPFYEEHAGQYADADLAPTYALPFDEEHAGQYADADLAPTYALPFDEEHAGQYADADLTRNLLFYFDEEHTGQYADADLKTEGGEEFVDCLGYNSQDADADLTLNPFDELDGDAYNSQDADADLTISFNLDGDAYNSQDADADLAPTYALPPDEMFCGQYGDADLTSNPFDELDGDAYNSQDADADLATTISMLLHEEHSGQISDIELETRPFLKVDVTAYSGEIANVFLNYTVSLLPRVYTGSIATGDLSTSPSESLTFDPTGSGEYGFFDVLEEDKFLFDFYSGEIANSELATTYAFRSVDSFNGQYADGDLAPTYAFYPNAYNGSNAGLLDLDDHPGEELDGISYGGQFADASLTVEIHHKLYPREIKVGQLLFDADWGTFNFCSTSSVYPPENDIIEFDGRSTDRTPWGICREGDYVKITCDLSVEPRFQATAYSGEAARTTENYSILNFEEVRADRTRSSVYLEPVIVSRFCPGYLIPVGSNVSFDFSNEINESCFGYFAQSGQELDRVWMKATVTLKCNNYAGQRATVSLVIDPADLPWSLWAFNGQFSYWWDMPLERVNSGEIAFVELERRSWEAYSGEEIEVDLTESIPGIFVVGEDCLVNEYYPEDVNGYPDTTYYQLGATVEEEPFEHQILGWCTKEYWSPITFYAYEFINNQNVDVNLTSYPSISGVTYGYNGQTVTIDGLS